MLIGRQALVVGAGIGGLTAALALARRGASVTLLERAEAVTEVGAGLQISPNGMAVLHDLGVAEAVAEVSVPLERVRLRDYRAGREVVTLDIAGAGFAHPWLLVHRADLVAVLTRAIAEAGVTVKLGVHVTGLGDPSRAGVLCDDGREVRSGVVVAADGVRSGLRPEVDGAPLPQFRKQVAYRALVPADGLPPEGASVDVFMGPGSHLVRYPLRGGTLTNLVAVEERAAWADDGWHHAADPDALSAAFAAYAPDVQADLEKVTEAHLWGLFRRPVARRWHRGRVALLGDAAHATLPFLAQGAVLAIEDAWVLADRLSSSDTVEAGLARYAAARRRRAARTVAAADRNALVYHLRVPGLRGLAHRALGLGERLRPGLALGRFDWLYRTDVTAPGDAGRKAGLRRRRALQ